MREGDFAAGGAMLGGPMGAEDHQGGLWPREDLEAPNGHGLRHMPDAVRKAFEADAVRTRARPLPPSPVI